MNFWPDLSLDEYINLKNRVETRMKISVMTSTGDDDLINAEEKGDLEYRKKQLKRLQEEVVDIEDMSSGISIMDLGLNECRLDLLDYIKNNDDLDKTPFGMHAMQDIPAGVIYVLKNINGGVNIDNQNRLHQFYMVYIANDGTIICDHLSPKEMLDKMRDIFAKARNNPLESFAMPLTIILMTVRICVYFHSYLATRLTQSLMSKKKAILIAYSTATAPLLCFCR